MTPATEPAADAAQIQAYAEGFRQRFERLRGEVKKMLVGQEDILEHAMIAMVAGGHVLLEGVPGLGKTMLVRSISQALDLHFQRIQFTPDLMPADLIGTKILVDDGTGHSQFEFVEGPIFCNMLLADEINRATPKTQSALLEAMQEKHVTVAGETRPLHPPFFVLATQNPLEMEGTYPLPEAQLDRFFFKLLVKYPSRAEFTTILERTTEAKAPEIQRVFPGSDLVSMGQFARGVPVAETIRGRAVDLVMATHPETEGVSAEVKKYVRYGASPRAGQACLLASKIRALLQGRFHVATEDLLAVALPVLRHRVMLNFEAQADGVDADFLLQGILGKLQAGWRKD
jgi:MoxR-like ATPase